MTEESSSNVQIEQLSEHPDIISRQTSVYENEISSEMQNESNNDFIYNLKFLSPFMSNKSDSMYNNRIKLSRTQNHMESESKNNEKIDISCSFSVKIPKRVSDRILRPYCNRIYDRERSEYEIEGRYKLAKIIEKKFDEFLIQKKIQRIFLQKIRLKSIRRRPKYLSALRNEDYQSVQQEASDEIVNNNFSQFDLLNYRYMDLVCPEVESIIFSGKIADDVEGLGYFAPSDRVYAGCYNDFWDVPKSSDIRSNDRVGSILKYVSGPNPRRIYTEYYKKNKAKDDSGNYYLSNRPKDNYRKNFPEDLSNKWSPYENSMNTPNYDCSNYFPMLESSNNYQNQYPSCQSQTRYKNYYPFDTQHQNNYTDYYPTNKPKRRNDPYYYPLHKPKKINYTDHYPFHEPKQRSYIDYYPFHEQKQRNYTDYYPNHESNKRSYKYYYPMNEPVRSIPNNCNTINADTNYSKNNPLMAMNQRPLRYSDFDFERQASEIMAPCLNNRPKKRENVGSLFNEYNDLHSAKNQAKELNIHSLDFYNNERKVNQKEIHSRKTDIYEKNRKNDRSVYLKKLKKSKRIHKNKIKKKNNLIKKTSMLKDFWNKKRKSFPSTFLKKRLDTIFIPSGDFVISEEVPFDLFKTPRKSPTQMKIE